MDPTGFEGGALVGWRARFLASWPAIRDRMVADGGIRTLLLLAVALGSGARAESVLEAAAAVLAMAFGALSLVLVPPATAAGSGAWAYLVARLSEPGTYRSLGVLVLAGEMGASAETVVDAIQALAMIALGGISAARTAPAGVRS